MESESHKTTLPKPNKKSPRRSRITTVLLIIAMLITLPPIFTPHVILRVPLLIVTLYGLWHGRRWSFPLLWVSGAVWILMFCIIVPFLLTAPPWVLWLQWLYWFIPTVLVLIGCLLMITAAGRAERANWEDQK